MVLFESPRDNPPSPTVLKNLTKGMVSLVAEKSVMPMLRPQRQSLWREVKKHWILYLMILPCVVFFVTFKYVPMVGLLQAFKEFRFDKNIFESDWVGFKYFTEFFTNYRAPRLIANTFIIGIIKVVLEFPFPILLALMINEVRNQRVKKNFQTISYLPHFISSVVAVAIFQRILAPDTGLLNQIKGWFGQDTSTFYMMEQDYFYRILLSYDVWKGVGWGSIIYLAAISGIDPQLYEAARIDGAKKIGEIWHITLPGIKPTIGIQFILGLSSIVSSGYEQLLLLRTPGNMTIVDTLDVFVIDQGLSMGNYAYATAVGLLQGIVALILVISANKASKKLTEVSVW